MNQVEKHIFDSAISAGIERPIIGLISGYDSAVSRNSVIPKRVPKSVKATALCPNSRALVKMSFILSIEYSWE